MNAALQRFLIMFALTVCVSSVAHTEGRDQIFKNPNPDRTWPTKAGTFFSSAKSYAVIISVSNYIGTSQGGYPSLATADDAEKMRRFLLEDQGFDYVHVVTDERATKSNIEKIVTDEFRKLVGPNDRFVLYWSGHGDQYTRTDTNRSFGFLPLFDSKRGEFYTMISMDDITRWNQYLSARHALFILDSCLSGLAGVEPKSGLGWLAEAKLDQLSKPSRYLITAGTSSEEVIAGNQWHGSLFTDAFIAGVKQGDGSVDGVISIFSLIESVKTRVLIAKQNAGWSKALTPQMRDLQGSDGAFFFLWNKGVLAKVPAESTPSPELATKGIDVSHGNSSLTTPNKPVRMANAQPEGGEVKTVSKLIQYVIPNSPIYSRGDIIKIKLSAASRYVKAYAIFPFESGERSKVEAKYSISEGGLFIPYKIPPSAKAGPYEIFVYAQEIQTKVEEKHSVEFEVRP